MEDHCSGVRDHRPLQQGLRLQQGGMNNIVSSSTRPSSTTTRIKTIWVLIPQSSYTSTRHLSTTIRIKTSHQSVIKATDASTRPSSTTTRIKTLFIAFKTFCHYCTRPSSTTIRIKTIYSNLSIRLTPVRDHRPLNKD